MARCMARASGIRPSSASAASSSSGANVQIDTLYEASNNSTLWKWLRGEINTLYEASAASSSLGMIMIMITHTDKHTHTTTTTTTTTTTNDNDINTSMLVFITTIL